MTAWSCSGCVEPHFALMLVPLGEAFMTTTSTRPVFVAEGVTAVIVVELTTTTLVRDFAFGEPPKTLLDGSSTKETAAPDVKPLPPSVDC